MIVDCSRFTRKETPNKDQTLKRPLRLAIRSHSLLPSLSILRASPRSSSQSWPPLRGGPGHPTKSYSNAPLRRPPRHDARLAPTLPKLQLQLQQALTLTPEAFRRPRTLRPRCHTQSQPRSARSTRQEQSPSATCTARRRRRQRQRPDPRRGRPRRL